MMKRWLAPLTLAMSLMISSVAPASAMEMQMETVPSAAYRIVLDGYELPTTPKPFPYNGRTMVPFRALADALGIAVEWEAATSTILARNDQLDIRLQLDNRTAFVNGQAVALDAEPVSIEGRTMIPLRFFSESVGAQVNWDPSTLTVSVTSQPRAMDAMVFYGLGSYSKRGYLPKFHETAFTWSILDEQAAFQTGTSEYRWPAEGADELLQEVKTAGVGTSLMVFSANAKGEISKLLRDPALQGAFISSLLAKLEEQNLDSAILDLESLGTSDKAAYSAFVATVADALHRKGRKLNIVVHPLNGWYPGYDYKELAKSADKLFLMAYSYIAETRPQPNDKVDEAIRLALADVPKEKLVLGINAFSETPATVKEKIGLAKRYSLGGVGFWILVSFDDAFLNAIDETLILNHE